MIVGIEVAVRDSTCPPFPVEKCCHPILSRPPGVCLMNFFDKSARLKVTGMGIRAGRSLARVGFGFVGVHDQMGYGLEPLGGRAVGQQARYPPDVSLSKSESTWFCPTSI